MFQVTVSDNGARQLSHPAGGAKASFDLLKVFGRDAWRDFVDEFGLSEDTTSVLRDGFIWHSGDVVVRTYNHPLLGVKSQDYNQIPQDWFESPDDYFYPKDIRPVMQRRFELLRAPEPAYCSYVHITGDEDTVREAFDYLNERGKHDGASREEWIV